MSNRNFMSGAREFFGRCPDGSLLAAYADRALIGDERSQVERHLMKCDECLRQVGFLVRTAEIEPVEVDPTLLRAATRTGESAQPNCWTFKSAGAKWTFGAVASIAALLLFTLAIQKSETSLAPTPAVETAAVHVPSPSATGTPSALEGSVRGTQQTSGSRLVRPSTNELWPPQNAHLEWTPEKRARTYEVKILTQAGDILWMGSSSRTVTTLPSDVHLVSGGSYYVQISARTLDGDVVRSEAIKFQVQ